MICPVCRSPSCTKYLERLQQRYVVDIKTGCWVWAWGTNKNGYGRLSIHGRPRLAHRLMYTAVNGTEPRVLDHLCRNTLCVNPQHLEPVTTAENARRGSRATLTMEQAHYIRQLYATGGYSFRSLAKHVGLGKGAVDHVLRNLTWNDEQRAA